jgi:hypothetical protein
VRIPVAVWRRNPDSVSKLVVSEQELVRVVLDPHREIADADLANNVWPPAIDEETIQLEPSREGGRRGRGGANPMRAAREAEEEKAKAEAEAKEPVEAGAGTSTPGPAGGGR